MIPCEGGLAHRLARRLTAQRLFEKEFGMDYRWIIRSEHVNVPMGASGGAQEALPPAGSRYLPFRLPSTTINLAVGITLEPLPDPGIFETAATPSDAGAADLFVAG